MGEKMIVYLPQYPGILIRHAANHDPVNVGKMGFDFVNRSDSAVQNNVQLREILLQSVNSVIVQWRYGPVFFRANTFEPGFSCMDKELPAAGI
jgi:hypothetical protein